MKELFIRLVKAIYYPLCMLFQYKYHAVSHSLLVIADGIVGVPFGGHTSGEKIGVSNAAILRVMSEVKAKLDAVRMRDDKLGPLPMATQWEMTEADDPPLIDVVIGEKNDFHISTYRFFYELRKSCPEWNCIIIVAHPDHIWRVARVAKRFGYAVLIPPSVIESIPYDPESRQFWCRYKWKFPLGIKAAFKSPHNWPFMLWEPVARVHHALKGWI